jgi:hypothetical protein
MPPASARRSFHGPLVALAVAQPVKAQPAARPLEVVPEPPRASALGRAILAEARQEAPSQGTRERVLTGVLSALKCLTGSP